jgi:transcriptional regulator with GAF, ATPase, and Fis domain
VVSATLTAVRDPEADGPVLEPLLFVALECDRPLAGPLRLALRERDVIVIGRGPERSWTRAQDGRRLDLQLPDRHLSSRHARLVAIGPRWFIEDLDSKNGTLIRGQPVKRAELADGDLVEVGHTILLFRHAPVVDERAQDLDAAALQAEPAGLATLSPGFGQQLDRLRRVAASGVSVVLHGESGTGKELLARALHHRSARAGAFVGVNCGALVESLAQSELFGYRRGAFSGATEDRTGLVRSAQQGTLFLDEIGDLPSTAQAILLRVLQEREVKPVGATDSIPVDIRVVCATHRDLDAMIRAGSFRHDLYARLAGFSFTVPPLRDRLEDIGLLTATFLAREGSATQSLSCAAGRALFEYPWPLNVRELEQAIGSAAVLARGAVIELQQLPAAVQAPARSAPDEAGGACPIDRPAREAPVLSEADQQLRAELITLLRQHDGNIAAVARAMGKDRKQIHRWIQRFGIVAREFRT